MERESADGNFPSSTSPSPGSIAMAPDPLDAIVNEQLQDKPLPHPDLAALAREAVSPAESEQFDPAVHESDPITGGPVFNKDGSLRRKRGRVAGKVYDAAGNEMPGAVGEGGCSPLQAKREARLCALSVFKALQSFGPQWQPSAEEEKAVIDPLAQWLEEVGGIGLPTWAEVAVAFGAYVICRINLARFLPPGIAGMVAGPAPSIEAMKQMEAMARAQQSAGAPLQSTPGKAAPMTAAAAPAHNPTSSAPQPPSPLFVPPSNGNVVRRVAPREAIAGGDGFSFASSVGNR